MKRISENPTYKRNGRYKHQAVWKCSKCGARYGTLKELINHSVELHRYSEAKMAFEAEMVKAEEDFNPSRR